MTLVTLLSDPFGPLILDFLILSMLLYNDLRIN